jgi:hypothetical protein
MNRTGFLLDLYDGTQNLDRPVAMGEDLPTGQ